MQTTKNKILVVKLSALGDFVQTFGNMRAIRENHPDDHIVLLTTKPYVALAEKSGYFDSIIVDTRPKLFQFKAWFRLANILNKNKFTRAYDLQCNDRSKIYFKLFIKKPEWVTTPDKSGLAFYRYKAMQEAVQLQNIEIDKLDWMTDNISHFDLKSPYILIVPGCAPSRPEKRWPAQSYGTLCNALSKQGYQCVVLGTVDEKDAITEIEDICPQILNLTGKTSLFDIVPLARDADIAIGNDTGPMHFIGPTGCKTLTLFSSTSDPMRHRPLGENVHTIQKPDISTITVEEVLEKAKDL